MYAPKSLKIFIVEDDPLFSSLLEDHLTMRHAHKVTAFCTGEACVDCLADEPQVIFLDLNLNKDTPNHANGLIILKIIRRLKANVPVIVISGQDDMSVAAQTLWNGAYGYIEKNESAFQKVDTMLSELLKNNLEL